MAVERKAVNIDAVARVGKQFYCIRFWYFSAHGQNTQNTIVIMTQIKCIFQTFCKYYDDFDLSFKNFHYSSKLLMKCIRNRADFEQTDNPITKNGVN